MEISIKKAAIINALGKYSKIIIAVIIEAVLARILTPEDYGVVAVITVFSTFFMTISDMGFGAAIVQIKELNQNDINNIYTFTIYIASGLSILFVIVSYPISTLYENEIYISLGRLLSVSLFFNTINMVPNGILNRDKKFVSIAFRTVVVYSVASVIAVILALFHFRYYAIAVQTVLTAFLSFLWNYITVRPKLKLRIEMESIKKIWRYSGYQFGFNTVNYFSRNFDRLLIGKLMGSSQLGYYNKAYTLMLYPVGNLSGIISPVLHPIFSDYQKQKEIIYKKYINVLRLLACAAAFVAPICFLGASEIITILYGLNWDRTVECFKILSIAILPQALNASASGVFQALGNTRLLFWNSCINTSISILAIIIGVFLGKSIIALSYCICVAYFIHFFTAFYMLISLGFKKRMLSFFYEILREAIIVGAMIMAIGLYHLHLKNVMLSLAIKTVYLSVIYSFMLFVTGEKNFLKDSLNFKS